MIFASQNPPANPVTPAKITDNSVSNNHEANNDAPISVNIGIRYNNKEDLSMAPSCNPITTDCPGLMSRPLGLPIVRKADLLPNKPANFRWPQLS
jgi:hypothetical protein